MTRPELLAELDRLRQAVAAANLADLPALVGGFVELEETARFRLRVETRVETAVPLARAEPAQIIDSTRAAEIAGTTRQWLLQRTRRLPFRCDLSRKKPRFNEAGLRRWLMERKR